MMIFLRKNIVPVLISVFIALLLLIVKPNGQEPGDQGVKQIQAVDLVASQYRSIECKYYAESLDPEKKYIPLNDTFFVHLINKQCYYVFPFYFSLLLAPIYDLLSAEAEYIIPFLCSVMTIWIFWFWSKELKLSEKNRIWLIINIGLGSGIFLYCIILSEISLNFFLVNLSFYLLWKFNQTKKIIFLLVPTLLLGLSFFFRQESLPLAFITLGVLYLYKQVTLKKIILVLPIYAVLLGIWLYFNFNFFQHPFGLRAIQQSLELSEGSFLLNRLYMYIEVLFYKRDNFGLLVSFPILILIPLQWRRIKRLDNNFSPFLVIALVFTFMIPLATITYQGFNWGTRFLLSMVPILLLSAFLIYEDFTKESPNHWQRKILVPSVIWSLLGSFLFLIVLILSHKQMQTGNKFVSENTEETIVLLAKGLEGFTISTHGKKKVLQALDHKQFIEIIKILKANRINKFSTLFPNKEYLLGENFFTPEILNMIEIQNTYKTKGINVQSVILK